MERLLRGLFFAVLVFSLPCPACRRQGQTTARTSVSESRPAQPAPPVQRVRLAERFERIATTRPCKQSDSRRFGKIQMGMAPWRTVREKGKVRIVIAHTSYRGKLYDAVFINSVSTTPGLKHIAYLARDGDRQFVVVDHREEPAFDRIAYDTIQLSSDGARVAYAVSTDVTGVKEWIADGKKLPESTFLRDFVFSPDGRYLAYVTRADNGWMVVVNDTPGSVYDRIITTMHFESPERFNYLIEKGNETFVVEERLLPQAAGR